MDNITKNKPEVLQTNSQTTISQPAIIEDRTKKSGQISVNKAFIVIYALIVIVILVGPEIVHDKSGTGLDQLAILFNGGFLLIILAIILHIFFLWREKKKSR